MRAAWLLIVLVAAPIAAAQTTTKPQPSLTLEPPAIDVPPGGSSQTRAVISNPLEREILLDISVHPPEGVKARAERPQLRIAAGGTESLLVTTLSPNASNVTHVVEVLAKEATAARTTAADGAILLSAKLELRVGASQAGAPLPPRLELTPRHVDFKDGRAAHVSLAITNPTDKPVRIADTLRFGLPPEYRVDVGAHPPLVGPGERVEIPLTFRQVADSAVGGRGTIHLEGHPAASASFQIAHYAAVVDAEKAAILAGAAAATLAAGAWTGGWLTRRHWWPFLLALYTRLRPSRILDHPVRRRITELVQEDPGISFSELARLAGIAPGQLTHHARMLEKAGVVFSSPDGQTRRFFHVGAGRLASVPPLSQRALDRLRVGPRRASDLAKDLGVSRQALHYHLKHLVAEGKLTARGDGRETWLELTPTSARERTSASSPRA